MEKSLDKKKIAVLLVSTNEKYWIFVEPLLKSLRKYFLLDHNVSTILWTDNPKQSSADVEFPAEDLGFPYATLLRYHLFLGQEEKLKEYDHLYYLDIDMMFVNEVGDEILVDGLIGVQHPGYAFKPLEKMKHSERLWFPPYERNTESTAYFRKPEYYFAGGFQGGKTNDFLKAMKVMKENIDIDMQNNYIARWNDESHWNCYLWYNPPKVIFGPDYCYPVPYADDPEKIDPTDAGPIYEEIWGQKYTAKLCCLTKKHHLSKEGGQAMAEIAKAFGIK